MSGQKTDARTRGYVRWACFFLLLSLVMAFFFGLLPVSPLAVATGSMEPSVSVGDAVVETLRPIREEATRILKDKAYLESVYRAGAAKASYVASKTLRKVYKKVGFVAL